MATMIRQLTPTLFASVNRRGNPFVGKLNKTEFETLVWYVVQLLAKNGKNWDDQFTKKELSQFIISKKGNIPFGLMDHLVEMLNVGHLHAPNLMSLPRKERKDWKLGEQTTLVLTQTCISKLLSMK